MDYRDLNRPIPLNHFQKRFLTQNQSLIRQIKYGRRKQNIANGFKDYMFHYLSLMNDLINIERNQDKRSFFDKQFNIDHDTIIGIS